MFDEKKLKTLMMEALEEVLREKYEGIFRKVALVADDAENFRLYSIPQVAKLFRKSEQTIRRWIRKGWLTTTHNNMITQAAINQFTRIRDGLENLPNKPY